MNKIPAQQQNQSVPRLWAGEGSPFLLPALCAVCFNPPSCSVAEELSENGCVPEIPSHSERPSWHACGVGERSSALCCCFGAAPARSWGSHDCFNPAKISAADAAKRSICVLWWVAELNEGTNPTASCLIASSSQPECQC